MRYWTEAAHANGMLTYIVETKRDKNVNCRNPFDPGLGRMAKDVLDTATELEKLPFVDGKNISVLGESLGAMTSLIAASNKHADVISPQSARLSSAISMYGRTVSEWVGIAKFHLLDPETTTPVLFLGGELDTETPVDASQETFDLFKKNGKANLEVKIFKEMTHCWDCKALDGFTSTSAPGKTHTYKFSDAVTEESKRLVFDFIKRHRR